MKTLQEVVNREIKDLGVNKDLAQDRGGWKSAIKMPRFTHTPPGD